MALGGTYGCFGIIAPEQVFKTETEAKAYQEIADKLLDPNEKVTDQTVKKPSNTETRRFRDLVKLKFKPGDKVEIHVENRGVDLKKKRNE